MAIQAIIPLIPLVMKIWDTHTEAQKSDKAKAISNVISKTTMKTELAQGGYVYALASIAHTLTGCNETLSLASLSCISTDQWVMLSGFASFAYCTLRAKLKG